MNHLTRQPLLRRPKKMAKLLGSFYPAINLVHTSKPTELYNKHEETEDDKNADLQVLSSNVKARRSSSGVLPGKGAPPDPPVFCCMSGCTSCVWLEYADELLSYYKDSAGPKAIAAIKQNVDDPNLKSYLLMELKLKGIK